MNAMVSTILYSLVATGSAWDDLKTHGIVNDNISDEYKAFLEIHPQELNTSSSFEQIIENELNFIRDSRFDAKNQSWQYDFEKHKRR